MLSFGHISSAFTGKLPVEAAHLGYYPVGYQAVSRRNGAEFRMSVEPGHKGLVFTV